MNKMKVNVVGDSRKVINIGFDMEEISWMLGKCHNLVVDSYNDEFIFKSDAVEYVSCRANLLLHQMSSQHGLPPNQVWESRESDMDEK